jgi:hypothetical protein
VGAVAAVAGAGVGIISGMQSASMQAAGLQMQADAQRAAQAAQMQQAENARAIAEYNAQISRQNNEVAFQMATYQATYAQRAADLNKKMMEQNAAFAQQQAAYSRKAYEQNLANAKQQELQAEATRAQSREAANREREKNDQALALVRSKIAAGGVTFEGTPMTLLSEAARVGELTVQDIAYGGELQSRKEIKEAEIQRFNAKGSLLEAEGHNVEAENYKNKAMLFQFDSDLAAYDQQIAGAAFRIGENQARLVELGGQEKAFSYEFASAQSGYGASALDYQAQGSLISGMGSAVSSGISGLSTGLNMFAKSGYAAPGVVT